MKRLFLLLSAAILLLTFSACDSHPVDTRVSVVIKTKPEGANITVNGKDCGKAPVGGTLYPGNLLIKAEKDGFETVWKSIQLTSGKKKEFLIELQPLTSAIMLKTTPAIPAKVTFNRKKFGQTPLVISGLKPGTYSASLKAPGYAPAHVSWEVNSKRPQMKIVKLFENTGKIRVRKGPAGAMLKINGRNYGTLPREIRLEQGEYQVEVSAPGYTVFNQKVSLKSNGVSDVNPFMTQLPASLNLTSNPSGALVTVNGVRHGSTPITVNGIKAGKVRVTFSLNNFDPVVVEQGVAPGKTLKIHRKLSSSLGNIEFVTVPAGVTVYLDNKLAGVTEPDPEHKGYSKVFRINNLKPGTHQLKFMHKLATPSEKLVKVNVEKNKNTRLPGNVELWIANARIVLKVGSVYVGRIVSENQKTITFEHKQGSRIGYLRSELLKIERFPDRE